MASKIVHVREEVQGSMENYMISHESIGNIHIRSDLADMGLAHVANRYQS